MQNPHGTSLKNNTLPFPALHAALPDPPHSSIMRSVAWYTAHGLLAAGVGIALWSVCRL